MIGTVSQQIIGIVASVVMYAEYPLTGQDWILVSIQALLSAAQYFQVWYTKENLEDYIDPNDNTLKIKLADSDLLRNRQEGHHNNQLVRIPQPCKDLRRRYLRLSLRSHCKAPPGSHRPSPLNEPSTATRWIKANHNSPLPCNSVSV